VGGSKRRKRIRRRDRAIAILNSMQAAQYFNPLICRLLAIAPLSCRALMQRITTTACLANEIPDMIRRWTSAPYVVISRLEITCSLNKITKGFLIRFDPGTKTVNSRGSEALSKTGTKVIMAISGLLDEDHNFRYGLESFF